MQYQFQIEAIPLPEIKRIVESELSIAIESLRSDTDRHEGIHSCRKALKKTRAVMRLTHNCFEPVLFQHANHTCRDQGRLLSTIRDATALIETLDKLEARHPNWLSGEAYSAIRNRLENRRSVLFSLTIESERTDERVIRNLEIFRAQVTSWHLAGEGFDAIFGPGLHKAYRQGLRRFAQAYHLLSETAFHEWRKRVKDLWYHSLLLTESWPELMVPYAEAVHQLSGLLGDEHDLNVFMGLIRDGKIDLPPGEETQGLLDLLEQEVTRLRKAAFPVAQRVYSEKPRAFIRRIGQYWDTTAAYAS